MKKLEFSTKINATAQEVWETLYQNADTYTEWVSPDALYKGKWEKGENVDFVGKSGGGTRATLLECKPYNHIFIEHTAVINKDGSFDTDSDLAKGWIGTTERYTLTESNGQTEMKVEINTTPAWASMFEEIWPRTLSEIKSVVEKEAVK